MRRLSFGAAGAVLAVAALLQSAQATPITYTLDDVTATFGVAGTTESVTLTGYFTFDSSGPVVDAVDATATGTLSLIVLSGGTSGSVSLVKSGGALADAVALDNSTEEIDFDLFFETDLGLGSDPLIEVKDAPGDKSDSVTGEAVPTVPEPASLSLLGGGLIALGMVRRRRRKAP